MMEDPIVDAVHRASERLIEKCGGIDGLFKHLRAIDRARARKAKQRIAKRPISNGRNRRSQATKSKATRVTKTG